MEGQELGGDVMAGAVGAACLSLRGSEQLGSLGHQEVGAASEQPTDKARAIPGREKEECKAIWIYHCTFPILLRLCTLGFALYAHIYCCL